MELRLLRLPLAIAGALALATSCGDDPPPSFDTFEEACDAVEGCGESRPGPTEDIWRVRVVREPDGTYQLNELERITVPADGVPAGPLGGEVALVGRDGTGENVDGQVLAFPDVVTFESRSLENGGRVAEPLEGARETMAYVRAAPSVETIAVIDAEGAVLTEMAPPAAIVAEGAVGERSSPLIQASSACPHVLLLDQGTLVEWQTSTGPVDVPIVDPGPMQQALVDAALARGTPALCNSVGRIAFGRVPDRPDLGGQVWSAANGDLILINVGRMAGLAEVYTEEYLQGHPEWRLKLMQTLLHEAGHAAEALLNEVSAFTADDDGAWLRNARGLAAQTIGTTRLRKGMEREWRRIHEGFVTLGWAEAYPPSLDAARETIGDWNADQVAEAGAMSRYGATSLADDIAELVAWTHLGPRFEAEGIPPAKNEREDFGCQAMATYEGDGVPSRYSALYSKLRFLQDLGLVRDDDVERCIGEVVLNPMTEGMHFFQGEDTGGQIFDQGVDGQIGTLDGRYVFEMVSEGRASFDGTEYPATATLRIDLGADAGTDLELVSWPRGAYRVAPGSGSTFTLRLPDAPAGDFDVTDGYAYVAESSNELIEGAVFVREAFRPNAPVPVPQVFDPPLNVRFRLSN